MSMFLVNKYRRLVCNIAIHGTYCSGCHAMISQDTPYLYDRQEKGSYCIDCQDRYATVQLSRHPEPPVYVTDLPGCDGTVPSKTRPNSDWGYGSKEHAIKLTPKQQQKLIDDRNAVGYPDPVFHCKFYDN